MKWLVGGHLKTDYNVIAKATNVVEGNFGQRKLALAA